LIDLTFAPKPAGVFTGIGNHFPFFAITAPVSGISRDDILLTNPRMVCAKERRARKILKEKSA
jgi:hypothetical protein